MKKKIIIAAIFVIIIALVLISLSSFFYKKEEKESIIQDEKEIQKEYDEMRSKGLLNDSKGLAEEKCIDSICIKNITIVSSDEFQTISGEIVNTSDEERTGIINIIFDDNIVVSYHYDNLESMVSKEFEIQDAKDDLMSVKTYRLEKE